MKSINVGECRIWTASKNAAGYAKIYIGAGAVGYAHRVAWIIENGPIGPGLEIDHLCRNRDCIEVQHLEVVTHAENRRRARFALARGACIKGHSWDSPDAYSIRKGGSIQCRRCHAESEARRRERMKIMEED